MGLGYLNAESTEAQSTQRKATSRAVRLFVQRRLSGGRGLLERHFVTPALARGHELTLFNRGKHDSEAFAGVETIHGDRHTELHKLAGRRWDVVVDTCGLLPRAVTVSAEALRDAVDVYVFVSSQSVHLKVASSKRG